MMLQTIPNKRLEKKLHTHLQITCDIQIFCVKSCHIATKFNLRTAKTTTNHTPTSLLTLRCVSSLSRNYMYKVSTFVLLLASSITLPAQTLITPTNTPQRGYWTGFNFSTTQTATTTSVDKGSSTGSINLEFKAPEGFKLSTATGGNFTVNLTSLNTGINSGNDATVTRYKDGPLFTGVSLTSDAQKMLGRWAGSNSSGISAFDGTSVAEYDFTGMTNGYLPAGTMFYLWDLDTATTGEGPITINSSATDQFMDLTWQGDGATIGKDGAVSLPNVFWNSGKGEYLIEATGKGNNDTDLTIFVTNQNLTSLTFKHNVTSKGGSHGIYMAAPVEFLPFDPVPEPTSTLLLGLAATAGLFRRNR